jgi:hypothetical protein
MYTILFILLERVELRVHFFLFLTKNKVSLEGSKYVSCFEELFETMYFFK